MKNVVLISADFPRTYWQFAKAFKDNGMNVIVIGGTPYNELPQELINNMTKYYCCWEMENLNMMKEMVGYAINEFGPIDFLESNNEYWLRQDSILREHFNIKSGLWPHELDDFQRKSSMKKYFENAGVKVAPYLLVDDLKTLKEFAEKYGYPLFAKPDIGVGAASNYKISNLKELEDFYIEKPANVQYICEVFVDSDRIETFDGIADSNSDAVIVDSMVCPPSIFEVKEKNQDMFYYVKDSVDPKLEPMARKVIKAMGLKNRFFHTEYFVASKDHKGWCKKGDFIGIEVNIRTPGGYTPDLLNFALSNNLYKIFANVICFGGSEIENNEKYFSACASRRYKHSYFYNDEDIFRTYGNNICFHGDYPLILSDIMGDKFYMAKFKNLEDVLIFEKYIGKRSDELSVKTVMTHPLTGEDARIMREKNSSSDLSELSICDKHIDGA